MVISDDTTTTDSINFKTGRTAFVFMGELQKAPGQPEAYSIEILWHGGHLG